MTENRSGLAASRSFSTTRRSGLTLSRSGFRANRNGWTVDTVDSKQMRSC